MKITEYSAVTTLSTSNVMLVDGPDGTKTITGEHLPFAVMNLASPEMHRMIFRGKNIGTAVTVAQKTAIQNGTFDDIWLGDYWEVSGVKWRVADFDYWYGTGDSALNNHHLVIMPDTALYTAAMNATSTTVGGYVGSQMYTTNLTNAKSTVTSVFSSDVLTHREFLSNTVTSGYPSAGAWTNSTVDLPSEPMIYGSYIYTPGNTGATDVKRYTSSKTQLALFAVAPKFIVTSGGYWLRDVVSASHFARVDGYGAATSSGGANSYGVRPVFAIG